MPGMWLLRGVPGGRSVYKRADGRVFGYCLSCASATGPVASVDAAICLPRYCASCFRAGAFREPREVLPGPNRPDDPAPGGIPPLEASA